MLVGVPSDVVMRVWEDVIPLLKRALDKSQGDYAIEDVFKALINRDMQLWVWTEDGVIEAACVTQIANYPQRRVCQLLLIGGSKMSDWLSFEQTMVDWAKENGCSQLEGFCRDGWMRVLTHWRKVWNTMRRDI